MKTSLWLAVILLLPFLAHADPPCGDKPGVAEVKAYFSRLRGAYGDQVKDDPRALNDSCAGMSTPQERSRCGEKVDWGIATRLGLYYSQDKQAWRFNAGDSDLPLTQAGADRVMGVVCAAYDARRSAAVTQARDAQLNKDGDFVKAQLKSSHQMCQEMRIACDSSAPAPTVIPTATSSQPGMLDQVKSTVDSLTNFGYRDGTGPGVKDCSQNDCACLCQNVENACAGRPTGWPACLGQKEKAAFASCSGC